MRTSKVSTSFSGFTDANLETKTQLILASMTGNPAFDPVVSVSPNAIKLVKQALANLCFIFVFQ